MEDKTWIRASVGPAPALEHLAQGVQALELAGAHRVDLGRVRWELGNPELARAEYELARETLAADGPSEDLAVANIRLAGLHAFSFDFEADAAVTCAEGAIAIATSAESDAARIWSYNSSASGRSGAVKLMRALPCSTGATARPGHEGMSRSRRTRS